MMAPMHSDDDHRTRATIKGPFIVEKVPSHEHSSINAAKTLQLGDAAIKMSKDEPIS